MDQEIYKHMVAVSNKSTTTVDAAVMITEMLKDITPQDRKKFIDWLKVAKREENHHIQQANTYGRMNRIYHK